MLFSQRLLESGEAEILINALSETCEVITTELLGQKRSIKPGLICDGHATLRAGLELEVS